MLDESGKSRQLKNNIVPNLKELVNNEDLNQSISTNQITCVWISMHFLSSDEDSLLSHTQVRVESARMDCKTFVSHAAARTRIEIPVSLAGRQVLKPANLLFERNHRCSVVGNNHTASGFPQHQGAPER